MRVSAEAAGSRAKSCARNRLGAKQRDTARRRGLPVLRAPQSQNATNGVSVGPSAVLRQSRPDACSEPANGSAATARSSRRRRSVAAASAARRVAWTAEKASDAGGIARGLAVPRLPFSLELASPRQAQGDSAAGAPACSLLGGGFRWQEEGSSGKGGENGG
eukprot:CAMPEP_0174922026 /NCGR_PEP_ID=MMETSP1355-20121228/5576_1 /TAXON_ID=464990 /ORGANISM="Hemiselmis tepida, Strain CCMP443" /LENGTH=161 /DNA_ID=CAMNT_0016167577 /DNA_START=150 /DNA_END=631 /DNA_ORIENTATION=-